MTQRVLRFVFILPLFFAFACNSSDAPPASGTGGTSPTGTGGSTMTGSGGTTPAGTGGSGDGTGGAMGTGGTPVPDAGPADTGPADTGMTGETGVTDPGTDGDGRFNINKPATPPEVTSRLAGVVAGTTKMVMVPAAMGFAGRTVGVYIPNGYVMGTPVAFMICHDGQNTNDSEDRPAQFNLPVVIDNLIFEKKIPMMIGIWVPNGGGARSKEYDTVNDVFTKFITTQVLPKVETLGIKLTTDPDFSSVAGHSSGGIFAFTQAWFEPDRYHRVLSLSGSYLNLQNPGGGMYDSLVRMTKPLKPIRIAMSAGTNDLNAPAWTNANETMGMALGAAGYHYRYLLVNGGTHTPFSVNRPWIPDLMTWLWRGVPVTGPTK